MEKFVAWFIQEQDKPNLTKNKFRLIEIRIVYITTPNIQKFFYNSRQNIFKFVQCDCPGEISSEKKRLLKMIFFNYDTSMGQRKNSESLVTGVSTTRAEVK